MALLKKIARPIYDFEKVAVRTTLGANPANYAMELQAQLFKQQPFLSEYDVAVQITKQDDIAGYLYGLFVARPRAYQPDPNSPSVRIPIIVANRRVYPFDIFINKDGQFAPLTQTRVSSALFEASVMKAVPRPTTTLAGFGDPSMQGFSGMPGNEGMNNTRFGQNKLGSITQSILPGVPPELVESFLQRIEQSPMLQQSILQIPAFGRAIDGIRTFEHAEVEKIASSQAYPMGAVLCKTAGGFHIEQVSGCPTAIIKDTYSKHKLAKLDLETIPVELRQEAMRNGYCLLDMGGKGLEEMAGDITRNKEKLAYATETGSYVTNDCAGQAQRVAVITNLHTIDGKVTNRSLVIGAPGAYVQEKLAGIRMGGIDLANLPDEVPSGRGVFVFPDHVTEPVDIKATLLDATGNTVVVEADSGVRYHLKLANIQKQALYGVNSYLFPDHAKFMPIIEVKAPYAENVDTLHKLSNHADAKYATSIAPNTLGGVDFLCQGRLEHSTTSVAETGVYLLAMGDTVAGAKEKIAALKGGSYRKMVVNDLRSILNYAGSFLDKIAAKSSCVEAKEIYCDLVKEAAVLAEPDTIDAVLSLSFVTPETCTSYLEHLPALEECAGKLAELLLGSRIGVPDIPEPAVCSAMSGVERAIQGLKKLQIRRSLDTDDQNA